MKTGKSKKNIWNTSFDYAQVVSFTSSKKNCCNDFFWLKNNINKLYLSNISIKESISVLRIR